MSTSALGTVLDALCAGWAARPGMSGVNVFTGPVTVEEAGLECIALGDAELTEVVAAMGGSRQESWDVQGELRVIKPWQGDTETTIAATRDRSLELFAEIETYINDTYLGELPDVEIVSGEMRPDFNPDGRACSLLFTLTIMTIKNP